MSVQLMLLKKLFQLFLEIEKKVGIFFNIFLPLGTLEIFADFDNVFKKILSKVFGDLFHEPCWDKIYLYINIHANINKANVFFNWSISDYEVFVIELNVIRIHLHRKFKKLLQIWLVMNWSRKQEELFTGVVQSAVANTLEKGLSCCKKRYMILSVSDSTVSGYLFFLLRNF